MSKNRQIMIEGYTAEELLGLPEEQIDAFILSHCPITFKVGSAEILGEFKIDNDTLVVELAHIDGGGEGVLPTLWSLINRHAERKCLQRVEWIVHAVHCANPNPKLKRVLQSKGFTIRDVGGGVEAYVYTSQIEPTDP